MSLVFLKNCSSKKGHWEWLFINNAQYWITSTVQLGKC